MAPPKPTGTGLGHTFTTSMSAFHVWLYRLTGGKIGGRMFNAPVALLTTTGHKSGQQRTTPLLYLEEGKSVVLVGSYAGADKPPAWATNLTKTPAARIQIGGRVMQVNSTIASAQRKAELWPRLVALYPDYQVYQDRTARDIPVFLLTPV